MKIQLFAGKIDVPKTSGKLLVDRTYEAEIMEVIPDPEQRKSSIIVMYLLYDTHDMVYHSYAEYLQVAAKGKFLWILRAVTNYKLSKDNFNLDFDVSNLLHKKLQIKFTTTENGFATGFLYLYLEKDKYTEMDLSQYRRPGWVRQQIENSEIGLQEIKPGVDVSTLFTALIKGTADTTSEQISESKGIINTPKITDGLKLDELLGGLYDSKESGM